MVALQFLAHCCVSINCRSRDASALLCCDIDRCNAIVIRPAPRAENGTRTNALVRSCMRVMRACTDIGAEDWGCYSTRTVAKEPKEAELTAHELRAKPKRTQLSE